MARYDPREPNEHSRGNVDRRCLSTPDERLGPLGVTQARYRVDLSTAPRADNDYISDWLDSWPGERVPAESSSVSSKEKLNLPTQKFSNGWSQTFQRAVLVWFLHNQRDFPWRISSDPFHLLIAEVLLRQTQAVRVVGPFMELISKYPDPKALANANVVELEHWFRLLAMFYQMVFF